MKKRRVGRPRKKKVVIKPRLAVPKKVQLNVKVVKTNRFPSITCYVTQDEPLKESLKRYINKFRCYPTVIYFWKNKYLLPTPKGGTLEDS